MVAVEHGPCKFFALFLAVKLRALDEEH